MAVRSPGSPPPTHADPGCVEEIAELPARAQRLLADGELAGYRRLLEELSSIADAQRRYWAYANVIELGLGAAAGLPPEHRPTLLASILGGALRTLERDPSEPRLLKLTGLALCELGSLDAAEAMFRAVGRLDAHEQGLESDLARLAARRRDLSHHDLATSSPLGSELPRLAAAVAKRARPAEGLRLSLCMIVRDEQEMLGRCLAAVADAVDEIVIVDTGSRDGTIEIARSFGANVLEREWTGSFAQARNASFDAASGEWLLYLDADEVLVREDAHLLRALTGRTWREAFYLNETNHTGELGSGTAVTNSALRVLRNRPEYRFEGRVHEQIAQRLPSYAPERIETTDIRVEHFGYLSAVRRGRGKSARNIELLRAQLREEAPTPFLHFNLGCEYAAAGDPRAALAHLERSRELLSSLEDQGRYPFQPALYSRLVKALRAAGRPREALARADEGLARYPAFTDLVLEQALAARELGEGERALALFERCMAMGEAPRAFTSTRGCGGYLPCVHLAELLCERGEGERAIALLEQCLREHPDLSASARFMLGTALCEAGASAQGAAQFRLLLERQPDSTRARVALAEALLAQGEYERAAAEAALVASDDPLAAIAARTELFARQLLDEDVTGALERARAAGMPGEEVELFVGWRELTERGETDIVPEPQSLERLERMLEALLRVQRFEAFETLLGLLERAPLSVRERRELLAGMYLRRGFAASAAREWMAVCEQGADARALRGLARAALAGGMPAEAREFAAAALECEQVACQPEQIREKTSSFRGGRRSP